MNSIQSTYWFNLLSYLSVAITIIIISTAPPSPPDGGDPPPQAMEIAITWNIIQMITLNDASEMFNLMITVEFSCSHCDKMPEKILEYASF